MAFFRVHSKKSRRLIFLRVTEYDSLVRVEFHRRDNVAELSLHEDFVPIIVCFTIVSL